MGEMRGFKMGSLNINTLVKHIDELKVVSLPRTCLKCLPIAPLFMIMGCDLPERILRSPKVAQIFTETVLHLPEQKSGMIFQTVLRKKLH